MQINAIMVALLDIAPEHRDVYNRWYDLDHLPEHVSKGDVVMGRRYAATTPLRAAPGIQTSAETAGHPPYATVYWFGGPLDFESAEARDGWATMDHRIVRAGRYWQAGEVPHSSGWRIDRATARPSIRIAEPAIAHLPHRGMILMLGAAPSTDHRAAAVAWWRDTQEADVLDTPGVLAVLECRPGEHTPPEQILHLVLCEESPVDVMPRLDAMRLSQRLTGRYPAHKGVYEQVALLPYQTIVPLDYDFDMD